jgi:hypothetical protein
LTLNSFTKRAATGGAEPLLQTCDEIKIGEDSTVTVDVALLVTGHENWNNVVDTGGIGWYELLPSGLLTGNRVEPKNLGRNLPIVVDEL